MKQDLDILSEGELSPNKGRLIKAQEAETFLDRVSKPRVSPCDDFYEHVCGRWGSAPSFEAALTAEGHRALRDALSSYPRGFKKAYETFEKLAAYYRSCYMDMESRHDIAYFVERFSETTGLRWDTLIAKRSPHELVDVLVAMSARFAISVVIRVVTLELKYRFVVSPLEDDKLISPSRLTTLLEKVVVLVNRSLEGDPQGITTRTQELHRKVLEAYSSRDRNESRLLGDDKTALPHLGLGDTASWLQAIDTLA
ncbi:hypothetical protein V5799_033346 [Amblyomma americanum]|uniref:Peptidase M13 N-terminal domain-containing protein n=1 Tax=Amblyomma americanum TaxID=6943 RepID=A0AAQ4DNK3_AMBAM